MHVRDATFVVTDTETTGAKAATDRLVEVAAVKWRGGEVVGRFQQLINPERAVPRRITQINGITTAMVFDQPPAAEVLPRYLQFLGDGVFVAQNAPFDLGFINAELKRLGRPPIENETLCTLRLARRLLPGLKSKGLTSLANFYGIRIEGRHRALGDAEATAIILERLLSQLAFEHEVETVEEVLRFQHRRYRQIRKAPRHLRRIREEVLPEVPDKPGVYFMKGKSGAVIYIGKAKSLGRRVKSYFSGVEAHDARRRKLVAAVRDVAWQETPSELDALLLESRLIKEMKPRFNRAGRRYRSRPFVRLDVRADFPRVTTVRRLEADGAEYFGPLGGRGQAELVMELLSRFFRLRECDDAQLRRGQRCLYADLDRCTAPCENGDAAGYAGVVERVRAFLTGQDRSLLEKLEEAMQRAAARLDYEGAAQYRDWHDKLKRLLDKRQFIAAPVMQHHAALVLPADGSSGQVFCIRFGRHVETITLGRPLPDADEERLRARLEHHFSPERVRPEEYTRRDVDEIRLLAHWMYRRRHDLRHVRWHADRSFEAFFGEVQAALEGEPVV